MKKDGHSALRYEEESQESTQTAVRHSIGDGAAGHETPCFSFASDMFRAMRRKFRVIDGRKLSQPDGKRALRAEDLEIDASSSIIVQQCTVTTIIGSDRLGIVFLAGEGTRAYAISNEQALDLVQRLHAQLREGGFA